MITGTETDFIISDDLKVLVLYKEVFEAHVAEATRYPAGRNKIMSSLYDTWFHMLGAGEEFGSKTPDSKRPSTIWFNITVVDAVQTHKKALANRYVEMQSVTEVMGGATQNSLFVDSFGYMRMVHQINQELNFEEQIETLEKEVQ